MTSHPGVPEPKGEKKGKIPESGLATMVLDAQQAKGIRLLPKKPGNSAPMTKPHLLLLLVATIAPTLFGQSKIRVLAAPDFPDSYVERYSDEGKLPIDVGEAEYQDMIAKHGTATLILRKFSPPQKIWELKSSKQMLDDARKNILAGDPATKLISEKDFTVDGFPGRSFVFSHEGGTLFSRMDYFLLKPDLFIYSCFGTAADLERTEVRTFFASIKTMEHEEAETSLPTPPAPSK